MHCVDISEKYKDNIIDIIDIQVNENREAIFFFYEDGSTSSIYKGGPKKISLDRSDEQRILNQGTLKGSIHTHPSTFDPSTIDIMTGVISGQHIVCVATPVDLEDIDEDFVLTSVDLSNISTSERRRLFRSMRRNSVGVTELGRQARKIASMHRFNVKTCRTHDVEVTEHDKIETQM